MVEDIIAGSSRIKWLFVAARNSRFIYKGMALDAQRSCLARGIPPALPGAGAGQGVVPHRTILNEGIPVAIGTDNVPFSPFFSLWNSLAREARNGEIVGPGQVMQFEESLALLTREGAKLSFDERRKGMLSPGMLADFAVLDRDLLSTPPKR